MAMSKRDHVIREILASETSFVDSMRTLVSVFVVPFRSKLPPSTHTAIFSNIQQLVGAPSLLCRVLAASIA